MIKSPMVQPCKDGVITLCCTTTQSNIVVNANDIPPLDFHILCRFLQ